MGAGRPGLRPWLSKARQRSAKSRRISALVIFHQAGLPGCDPGASGRALHGPQLRQLAPRPRYTARRGGAVSHPE
eukprot:3591170-Alexandrium_andersonii.AAC.1